MNGVTLACALVTVAVIFLVVGLSLSSLLNQWRGTSSAVRFEDVDEPVKESSK